MTDDDEILEEIISDNEDGLKRLAREEPAEESRSRLKRLKARIRSFLKREEKVGRITA